MARTAKSKLAVDGTDKLAAKSKPSDKHEQADLNIEEATVASPRESKKRAGDFHDFGDEADDFVDAAPAKKEAQSKAAKPNKKAKTAPAAATQKADKPSKAKAKAGVDASNEDATLEGSSKPSKKKGKIAKDDSVIEPSDDTAAVSGTVEKPEKKVGKAKGKKVSKQATAEETLEDRVKADAAKPVKEQKSKTGKEDVVIGPSGDTAAVEVKPKKGKAGKEASSAKDKSESAKVPKGVDKALPSDSASSKKPKKAVKENDTTEKKSKPKKAEKEDAPASKKSKGKEVPAKSTKKPKAASKKAAPEDDNLAVDPDLAMDEGPFESLLETEDGGAPKAADTGAAKSKPSKSKKDNKKSGKDANNAKPTTLEASAQEKAAKAADTLTKEANAGVEKIKKGADTIKKGAKAKASEKIGTAADSGKAEPSKSKKRKTPDDAETVKTDLLDPLSELASTTKKQKKGKSKSFGESMGDLVNSGLGTVASGANAVRESLGALAGGAQSSIAESAPDVASGVVDAKESTKATAKKAKSKAKEVGDPPNDPVGLDANEDSDSEVDDQTAALLRGFESSADEEHPGPEDGFKEGSAIPKIPNSKETSKKLKALPPSTMPGVVYLGRIPHGFYEHEQRKFFSQFGNISRLRLSRNKLSGKSKHFAFVEFESEDVAKIVAESMDNYLMFGHQLKCKLIPKENLHESIWKGANKRFKTAPRNKMEKRKLELPVGRSEWADRIEGTQKKRESTLEKAKAIGYEFTAPALKGVESVPRKIMGSEIAEEQEKSLVTAGGEEGKGPMVISEEVKTKKVKKGSKGEVAEATTTTVKKTKRTLEDAGDVAGAVAKKTKKAVKDVAA